MKHYVNEKSAAAVSILERPGSVKESVAAIFKEIVTVLKDEQRRNECFILHSAIDQVPHNPEIAQLFRQDSGDWKKPSTRLWSVPGSKVN